MIVERVSWPCVVPDKLARACGDDIEAIKAEVMSGICHMYSIESETADLLVVTRGEESAAGREFVVVCVAGHGMKEAGKLLIDNARRLGFDRIRYHAKSPAVNRLYSGFGFGGEEIGRVYAVELGEKNG